jgi:hypothetical protein
MKARNDDYPSLDFAGLYLLSFAHREGVPAIDGTQGSGRARNGCAGMVRVGGRRDRARNPRRARPIQRQTGCGTIGARADLYLDDGQLLRRRTASPGSPAFSSTVVSTCPHHCSLRGNSPKPGPAQSCGSSTTPGTLAAPPCKPPSRTQSPDSLAEHLHVDVRLDHSGCWSPNAPARTTPTPHSTTRASTSHDSGAAAPPGIPTTSNEPPPVGTRDDHCHRTRDSPTTDSHRHLGAEPINRASRSHTIASFRPSHPDHGQLVETTVGVESEPVGR